MPSKRPTDEAEAGPSMSAIADYDLPKTTVTKIAKSAFGDQTIKFQQDVFLALQKSATVYINYIASAAQEHADAVNRKTLNPQDIILATTEHLSGIGGDMNAANELREVLEDELQAFRENQTALKAAKAAGGPYTGPKRGFPGRGKNAAAALESELLDDEEEMPLDEPADGPDEANVQIGNGHDDQDGEDSEVEEEDEVDHELAEDLEDEEEEDGEDIAAHDIAAHQVDNGVVPGSDDEPREDDDTEMS
ncbi:hypothetical protein QFC20_000197 [Naganishia adeliensis]|uniref:Uncharacterized protein n=1 Tax=Naganishia adeliensis TaxID=92952 RepID=A0ACC2X3D2_9TREE|nr:hypothetical protein QFC20_000197 [Naganishia adeliensis]